MRMVSSEERVRVMAWRNGKAGYKLCVYFKDFFFFHLASYLASIYQLYFFLQKNILSKYRCLSSGGYNTKPLTRWYTNNRN